MSNIDPLATAVAPVAESLVSNAPPVQVIGASWYAINLKPKGSNDETEAEISIYDAIGGWGISAATFVRDLKAIKASTINVRINTPGGEVFDGTAIYNALREHPARIVTHIDGIAASAGSFVALSGDEVRMADNAYLMIHNARGGMMGESDDMRRYADILDKINGNIAAMYQRKAGNTTDHWRGLMDAETWFTGEEAKAEGLVDSVYAAEKKTAARGARAEFDFKIYNKIPDAVKTAWGIQQQIIAPEASRESETPTAVHTETTTMAEITAPVQPSAPAQIPAAVVNVSQGNPQPPISRAEQELANLRLAAEGKSFETANKQGYATGYAAATAKLKAIIAACPGDPQMAVNAFVNGQSAEAVQLAYESANRVKVESQRLREEDRIEIERLKALIAIGGAEGVEMNFANIADASAVGIDPKVQAEQEWEQKPMVRKGFTSKDRYINSRVAELKGQFRSHTASGERV